jgi:hypothetical protein
VAGGHLGNAPDQGIGDGDILMEEIMAEVLDIDLFLDLRILEDRLQFGGKDQPLFEQW